MCINENMLSQVQKDIHKYYYGKDASDETTNKLVLNVMDKKKYVLHISALKFYLQHGLRGGMTQCSFKKVEANNKYMNEDYDKSKPPSYISYLDANE